MIPNGGTLQYYVTTTQSWKVMVTKAGGPEDITLKTIYFTVKNSAADADPGVFQDVLFIVDGPTGEARLDLIPTDFAGATPGIYCADIKYIKTATTEVYVIWEGRINLMDSVTDRIT